MSLQARQDLVAKLTFTDGTQKSDLLDPTITDTWLIAMLTDLVTRCAEPIEILAVRTDHPSKDGPWAHSGGLAVDLYPKNWEGREKEAVVYVMKAVAENPYAWAIGFGGVTQQWQTYVSWPTRNFVAFNDSDEDHLHVDAAMNGGGPGDRIA